DHPGPGPLLRDADPDLLPGADGGRVGEVAAGEVQVRRARHLHHRGDHHADTGRRDAVRLRRPDDPALPARDRRGLDVQETRRGGLDPFLFRTSSMNSRTAPRPPAVFSTTFAAWRAWGAASEGQAEKPAAFIISTSGSSSPIAAVSSASSF